MLNVWPSFWGKLSISSSDMVSTSLKSHQLERKLRSKTGTCFESQNPLRGFYSLRHSFAYLSRGRDSTVTYVYS